MNREEQKTVALSTDVCGSRAQKSLLLRAFGEGCRRRAEKNGAKEELMRLIEERYLPQNADELVYLDELERFFDSELYQKIKSAKQVIREQRFNILLPAAMFSKDKKLISDIKDEMLAVQGVIDLLIIDKDDKLCLYDYKTDRLSADEFENEKALQKKMASAHSEQLSYYKLAVSMLFERECDVSEIYSTHAAKTVKI